MTPENFVKWLENKIEVARIMRQRRLIVLAGELDWAISLLNTIPSCPFLGAGAKESEVNANAHTQGVAKKNWHIYSDEIPVPGSVNKHTFQATLGTESHFVLHIDKQLNIDAFAALSGTLVPGGICFIILPSHFESSSLFLHSPFLQRFTRKIRQNSQHSLIQQGEHSPLDWERCGRGQITAEEINKKETIKFPMN